MLMFRYCTSVKVAPRGLKDTAGIPPKNVRAGATANKFVIVQLFAAARGRKAPPRASDRDTCTQQQQQHFLCSTEYQV